MTIVARRGFPPPRVIISCGAPSPTVSRRVSRLDAAFANPYRESSYILWVERSEFLDTPSPNHDGGTTRKSLTFSYLRHTALRAAENGDTVIAIHPSKEVSGTVPSAFTAKSLYPDADIRIIDMRTLGGCLAEAVKSAIKWRDEGRSADDIVARLEALVPRVRTYFVVATLEYLRRNGRIGGASAENRILRARLFSASRT